MDSPNMSSMPSANKDAANSSAPQYSGLRGALYVFVSFCLETGIHLWVSLTGALVRKADAPWLSCPLGGVEPIGTGIYERVAREEGLEIRIPPDAGLLPSFNVLRGPSFDPDAVHPQIRHFYEHAAQYHLEVWSEVSLTGRFFLWLLVEFISRRMDQLNFPISSLEVAKGMSSEVLQLVERSSGRVVYTGWLRRLKSSGRVIYAGLYSTVQLPGESNPCVKVTFPCRGSANVYLSPEANPDGSFGLASVGTTFGRSGFYRLIDGGADHFRVRHVRSLREVFHVYVDADGVLRTDHTVFFLGLTILRLHYKMTRIPAAHIATQEEQDLIAVEELSNVT
jgi:hypothetical protein